MVRQPPLNLVCVPKASHRLSTLGEDVHVAPSILIPNAVHGVLLGFEHTTYKGMPVAGMDCSKHFSRGL